MLLTLCQSGETYVRRWYNYHFRQHPPKKHKVKDGDMILIQKEELDKSVNRSLHDIG